MHIYYSTTIMYGINISQIWFFIFIFLVNYKLLILIQGNIVGI